MKFYLVTWNWKTIRQTQKDSDHVSSHVEVKTLISQKQNRGSQKLKRAEGGNVEKDNAGTVDRKSSLWSTTAG